MKMLIPPDWDGQSFCRYAVCWPDSPLWKIILRGLVSEPARGFFWDERTGTVTEVLAGFRQTLDENLDLPEVIMACGDTGLQPGLEAIAQAIITASINNSGGSGGSGGCTCVNFTDRGSNVQIQNIITLSDGTQWPIFGTGPLPTLPPSGIPDGYEDQTEYDADKCAKANKIVNDLIDTLSNFSVLNLGVGVVGAVAVLACLVGLIVVPAATIPLLLWALLGNVTLTTVAGAMANYITEHHDEIVCILYKEDNLETMINLLADFLDIAVGAIGATGAVAIAIKSVVLWLMNGDTLGVLLTDGAKGLFPNADCTGCVCQLGFLTAGGGLFYGSGDLSPTGETRTLTASFIEGWGYGMVFEGNCECQENWQVTIDSLDGYIANSTFPSGDPEPGDRGGFIQNCAEEFQWRYHSHTAPSGTYCGKVFQFGPQDSTFTVDVTIERDCS